MIENDLLLFNYIFCSELGSGLSADVAVLHPEMRVVYKLLIWIHKYQLYNYNKYYNNI